MVASSMAASKAKETIMSPIIGEIDGNSRYTGSIR
jgi:hypothetical protein